MTTDDADAVALWWWVERGRPNFGDILSPRLVKQLVRREVHRSQRPGRVLAIGSILKWARDGDIIWGSGHAGAQHATARGVDVRCVRGPVTAWLLRGQGVKVSAERYGDPALLLPLVYAPNAATTPKHDIGLVPHYVDRKLPQVLAAAKLPSLSVIDICAGIENVIDALCSCKLIVTSSLHAIVAAESYGVPAVWVELSDGVVGGGMKFRDYYESTGRQVEPHDARQALDFNCLEGCRAAPIGEADYRRLVGNLLKTLPWPLGHDDQGEPPLVCSRADGLQRVKGTNVLPSWSGWRGGKAI